MTTRLWEKLARIHADPSGAKDFLICDAKDADMGGGMPGPGPRLDADGKPTGTYKSRAEHLAQMKALVEQDVLDMMLTSVCNLEALVDAGVFKGSKIGTSVRANDATDIWSARDGSYRSVPSRPFRTAHIPHMMYGRADVKPGSPVTLTDLGLYSVTFTDDVELDRASAQAYRDFRIEAEHWGFKHFLEVFNPNAGRFVTEKADIETIGRFVNDNIARVIAGVPKAARPQFLKIPFNGPKALTELVNYDPTVIVGILGGGAGTTRDCFELLAASVKYGARLVLFGRKINLAEDPLAIVAYMRRIADGDITAAEAVKAYHGELQKAGKRPIRELSADSEITEAVLR